MEGHPGANEVAYFQGETGKEYNVTELLLYLELFNCERYTNTKHPSGMYRNEQDVGNV